VGGWIKELVEEGVNPHFLGHAPPWRSWLISIATLSTAADEQVEQELVGYW